MICGGDGCHDIWPALSMGFVSPDC